MRVLLEQFEKHRDDGVAAIRAGDGRAGRYNLLKAAEYLFRVAAKSKGDLREKRKRSAAKLLAMAKDIDVAHRGEEIPEGGAGGKRGKGKGASASQWIVTRKPGVRFDDVAGLADVKALIRRRVIYPFQHPEVAARYKKRAGGGVLLYGPPGTGKTMIAKAIATELDAVFFSVKCSDIISKWVGEAEKNLGKLFAAARACPCAVIFMDETEAIVARRGGDSTVMNRVIPEFLAQVDGVDSEESALLLLGATNRPWDMDEAALRTGRFGELIYVGPPDYDAVAEILRMALDGVPMSGGIDLASLARRLDGFTGADVVGFVERVKDRPFEREISDGAPSQVEVADMEAVLAQSAPSVTKAMLARYDKFRQVR